MASQMVTKAELAAELAALKEELSARKTAAAAQETTRESAETETGAAEGGKAALAEFLKSHGIDEDSLDIDALWQRLSDEIGAVAGKQPVLTGIAIFALGFMLGRASK